MRTLVTGGCGFIGSNLVDRLVAEDHEVVVVDDLSSGTQDNLRAARAAGRVHLERVDVAGPDAERVIAAARPEVVYHLAAQMDVRRSVEDPLFDARVNVLGSIAVARAASSAGCRRLVFAGSGGTAYGEPDPAELPLSERATVRWTNPYGVAKRTVEDYLDTFRLLWGLEGVSLRLANVYGPRQNPHGEAGVVAIFCARLLEGRPVVIYGDGRQTRDYVYVDDVVDAFLSAGTASSAALTAPRLNIGTAVETSVLALYETLRTVAGLTRGPDTTATRPAGDAGAGTEPTFAPLRTGELQRVALDSDLAGDVLGWRPKVDLAEGLRRTWAWAREHLRA